MIGGRLNALHGVQTDKVRRAINIFNSPRRHRKWESVSAAYLPEEGRRALSVFAVKEATASLLLSEPPGAGDLNNLEHYFQARWFFQTQEVVADSKSGRVFISNARGHQLLSESTAWPLQSLIARGAQLPSRRQEAAVIEDPVIVLPAIRNYFHWLFEGFANFLITKELAKECVVVTSNEQSRFQEMAIDSLDITVTRVPEYFIAKNLYLLDRGSDLGWVHPAEVEVLRSYSSTVPVSVEGRAIYVSRRRSSRSLPQEEVLEKALEAHGLEVVFCEDLSFFEQISLFKSVEIVVAPHGAGLANLAFCRPGTRVVELMPANHMNRCYQWLAGISGLGYKRLFIPDEDVQASSDLARLILEDA